MGNPRDIVELYFRKFRNSTGRIRRHFRPADIHGFRVDVKRFRAFLRLLRLDSDRLSVLKVPKAFKKMYSTLGKVRDLQLMNARDNDNAIHSVPGIHHELKKLKVKAGKQMLDSRELLLIRNDLLRSVPGTITRHMVLQFITHNYLSAKEIADKKEIEDDQLHELRKLIKDIIYLFEIFEKDLKEPLRIQGWNRKVLASLESMAHLLGNFNDLCSTCIFLEKEMKKGRADKQAMLELAVVLRRKARLRNEIRRALVDAFPRIKQAAA
jgi:CHAD domain-containing protein